jgi:hypothetical protein
MQIAMACGPGTVVRKLLLSGPLYFLVLKDLDNVVIHLLLMAGLNTVQIASIAYQVRL